MKQKNQIEASRAVIEASIDFQASLSRVQRLSGLKNVAQAVTFVNKLLEAIKPMASVSVSPKLLKGVKTARKPPESLDALVLVLGRQTLSPAQITMALQQRGWLTKTTRAVRYVADLLSRNSEGKGKNRFVRVRPGYYKAAGARKLVYRKGP